MEVKRYVGTYGKSYDPGKDKKEFDFLGNTQKKVIEKIPKKKNPNLGIPKKKNPNLGIYLSKGKYVSFFHIDGVQYYAGKHESIELASIYRKKLLSMLKRKSNHEERNKLLDLWKKNIS